MPDPAFDTALDVFDQTDNVALKCKMAGILAHGWKDKPGMFERLIEFLRTKKSEPAIVATYLGDLGDPGALPNLHNAFRGANNWVKLAR